MFAYIPTQKQCAAVRINLELISEAPQSLSLSIITETCKARKFKAGYKEEVQDLARNIKRDW